MAIDSGLIREINEGRFNPWKGSRPGSVWVGNNLPPVDKLQKIKVETLELWIGIDVGFSPDPTSVVLVRHLRLVSDYGPSSRERVTSFYRLVRCQEWSGVPYPEQRELVQGIIDSERQFNERICLILDGTGVGKAVSQDWEVGLQGLDEFRPVTMVSGQPRSIGSVAVSDLIQNTQSAFQQGRVALPARPSGDQTFLVRKLQAQLTTRGIEEDYRGRLKAIDERKSGLNHYDLSVALSLVVGHVEQVTSNYSSVRWVC